MKLSTAQAWGPFKNGEASHIIYPTPTPTPTLLFTLPDPTPNKGLPAYFRSAGMGKGKASPGRTRAAREQLRGIFEAHRLVYHSTLGLRVIKKKKNAASQTREQLNRFEEP